MADTANGIKEFFKRWPRFYYFVFDFFGPVYFGGVGPGTFINKYSSTGTCLNLGSGARRIAPEIVNVDITQYDAVDVVADITSLPYEQESIDCIICDQVLEHVRDPNAVVAEMYRVLKSGGYVYISTPFMYPFHASPSDYQRFTHIGLRELLKDFEMVDMGVRCGPFSTLTTYLCYLFASLLSFGNERLYWTLVLGSTFVFFPIKFLDIIGNKLPFAIHMASVPYCIIQKNNRDYYSGK
jgi:SAM-dependent methyltransferase